MLVLAVATPLAAQEPRGQLRGTVTDATMSTPVAGARVLLIAGDTLRLVTDARGEWASPALPAGAYRVVVRALGFQSSERALEVRASVAGFHETLLTPVALRLDDVVVTAARREQRLKDAIVATEVIGRDEIERSGASDVAAVLVEQTGIELHGGHPAGTGVMIQGLGSERVLVLLDGQPVAGRIAGEFDVSRIPTSSVERIEVVKGPQAALYGSDAMGGVINVITRAARQPGVHLGGSVLAGSQARLDGAVSAELAGDRIASRIDIGRRRIESTPGRADIAGALAERRDLAAKASWTAGHAVIIETSLLALDERQRWRSAGLYSFADNQQWNGKVSVRRAGFRALVSGSSYDHLSRGSTQPLPIAGDTGQRQLQRIFQGELMYGARFGRTAAHALDVGAQLRRDDTRSVRIPGGLRTLHTVEPLAQLELAPTGQLGVSVGMRVSRSSRWGTHVTPRLAVRHRPADALTLRASVGTGFRAPDFRELYMSFVNENVGYAVRGNPDLRPEHSRNVSVGAELASDAAFARVQLFWNEFRDFIETRPVSAPDEQPVYAYSNVDDGRTRGAELETGVSVSTLQLEAGVSVLETRDRDTGRGLLGRPPHSARLTAASTLPLDVRMSVTGLYTGRTPMQSDADGAISSWRDAFARMDARASRAIAGDVRLVVGADNLFDRQPRQWAGATRRQLYTALSWSGAGILH